MRGMCASAAAHVIDAVATVRASRSAQEGTLRKPDEIASRNEGAAGSQGEVSGEPPVEAPVGSFVDGAHTRSRMARSECDEHPDELALLVTRELHDHAEGSLRRGPLCEGQVDLRAARQARAIRAVGLARAGIRQR